MSLANAKEQLLQQYWMTLLHYNWSDLSVMDRMDGFVQSPSFSLWFFTKCVCDKKRRGLQIHETHRQTSQTCIQSQSGALSPEFTDQAALLWQVQEVNEEIYSRLGLL